MGSGHACLPDGVEHQRGVAVEVPDDGVHLGQGEAKIKHATRVLRPWEGDVTAM